jgi:hypothetical protein
MEDVTLIADLHSLPSGDVASPLDVTPQRKKEKTFEALLRQVEGLADPLRGCGWTSDRHRSVTR